MRKMSIKVILALAIASSVLVVSGCGEANRIKGSIDESLPMDFDRVVIRKQSLTLSIEYVHDVVDGDGEAGGGSTTTVLGIIVKDVMAAGLAENVELVGENFSNHVRLTRRVAAKTEIPEVLAGSFITRKFDFVADGRIKGQMDVVFVNGRTLATDFDGLLEEIVAE